MGTPDAAVEREPGTPEDLQAENAELRRRLEEAEETIRAIQKGAVDAFVIEELAGHRVYTLEGADRPCRLFVEQMLQGAATLQEDGTIVYCNRRLADMLKVPQEKLMGAALHDFVADIDRGTYDQLLQHGKTRSAQGETRLKRANGTHMPVYLSVSALPGDCGAALGVFVSDLTSDKRSDKLTAAYQGLRASGAHLTAELAEAKLLQNISAELIQEDDVEALYQKIMNAAAVIMHSDCASMQILYPEEGAAGSAGKL